MITTMENVMLTPKREAQLTGLFVQVQGVVDRVSREAYGEFCVRRFRRDLPTGALDPYLTDKDKQLLAVARQAEGEVISAYVGLIGDLAGRYLDTYRYLQMEMEDLVQEGCMAVIHALYGYTGISQLSNYCRHSVQRWMDDIRRSRKVRVFDATSPDAEFDLSQIPDAEPEEEPTGDVNTLRRAMTALKGRLTPLERTVLDLYPEMGYGCCSEAARRNINPKTLKPFTRAAGRDAMIRVLKMLTEEYQKIDRADRKVA